MKSQQATHTSSLIRIRPPRRRRVIHGLDVRPPLLLVRPQYPPVVRQQPVDLALDVRGLRVHAGAAAVPLDLADQLGEDLVGAVVVRLEVGVDLVRLRDLVDGLPDLPQVRLGDVVAQAAELALDADADAVVGARGQGVGRGAALRVGVVVVILERYVSIFWR